MRVTGTRRGEDVRWEWEGGVWGPGRGRWLGAVGEEDELGRINEGEMDRWVRALVGYIHEAGLPSVSMVRGTADPERTWLRLF